MKKANKILDYFATRFIQNLQLKGTEGKYGFYSHKFWTMAGNMAERFHEIDSAEYDHLQERLYFNLLSGLRDVFENHKIT